MHAARIAHHIPGRMRIVIPAARRNLSALARVAGEVEKLAHVRSVDINPAAGSLVVHYVREQSDFALAVHALGRGLQLFELALEEIGGSTARRRRIDKRGSEIGRELITAARVLNRELKLATDGAIDLRLLVPLGTAGLTALNAQRANGPTPLWLTLLTFAFNSFVALHRGVPLELPGKPPAAEE